jgi:hypothetical protein
MKSGTKSGQALAPQLARALDPARVSFDDAWVGLEPTFQSKKCIKLYEKLENEEGGEDEYFTHPYMVDKVHSVTKDMAKRFKKAKKRGAPWAALFDDVEVKDDVDPWNVLRSEVRFDYGGEDTFDVKFGMDPSTFELGIKPVPVAWLLEEEFVTFLQELVWDVAVEHGLSASMYNGGGQFHIAAKCMLAGSVLADDVATRLDHPELSTWTLDWPNCDDRPLRSTARRFAAFRTLLDDYWRGAFHPKAIGVRTVEDAYFDRGFMPAANGASAPLKTRGDVFRTNFAFGRAVQRAQTIDPGYWQLQHPNDDGFRPDQIGRYSEVNGNRLQVAGELHVKSGRVLDAKRVREIKAALEPGMLASEASWELRGHMSRTSARDSIEAVMLEVNHARWLSQNPRRTVRASLEQDQLLVDAERTVRKHKGPKAVDALHREARKASFEVSKGRVKSDFIEPETLFWAAWNALPKGARAAVAREVLTGFVEIVDRAASVDPRGVRTDPMEEHRHRVHPLLWSALRGERTSARGDRVKRELELFERDAERYLARRPVFSQAGHVPPWGE